MARFIKDRTASQGQGPGSLILIGKQKMDRPEIHLMDIESEELLEQTLETIGETTPFRDSSSVSWINIWGIHDTAMIGELGEIFRLHPLFLEDILNTDQLPGFQEGESYEALILKMIKYIPEDKKILAEQLTLILGQNYVVTLQEQPGDVFNSVRERIRDTKKRLRFNNADYLAYMLLDAVVDNYMIVTETLGREIEALDERLFAGPDPKLVQEIHRLKTELSFLRKSVRPFREAMMQVLKSDSDLFKEQYRQYFRDVNDLVIQTLEAIELYSSMISDHLNIYSTNLNNRSNDVMKVLTIFASIFIPLTFLAGIYGMNFKYFPELGFRYSYLIFWIIVIIVSTGLLIYFRRKKWF